MALPRMLAVLVVIGLVGLAGQVQAATIRFPFTGLVTEVSDDPELEALGVVLGALVSDIFDPPTSLNHRARGHATA